MRNAAALHGRPTMVIASSTPANSQARPEMKPPKMNHRMLRISVMAADNAAPGSTALPESPSPAAAARPAVAVRTAMSGIENRRYPADGGVCTPTPDPSPQGRGELEHLHAHCDPRDDRRRRNC